MHNHMTPSNLDQRAVVAQVLSTMANIHLLPEQAVDAGSFFSQQPLASMMRYSAPVNQVLTLQCSPALALQLTASLFERSLPTSTCDADITDTMIELLNMIGGNLKALMPDETSIGVPWALDQSDMLVRMEGQLGQTWFATSAGLMCLTFAADASA